MFEDAVIFTMQYEVGPWFKLDDATRAGLIDTAEHRKAVGFVNDPADNGGLTKFGVAQNAHPERNVGTMTWEDAKAVYANQYWLPGKCQLLPTNIAFVHFDACVNHGVGRGIKLLQKAAEVKDDGIFGQQTMTAISLAVASGGFAKKLIDVRRAYFNAIVEGNASQKKFLKGWLARCDSLEKALA